jgi:hypothetical protein
MNYPTFFKETVVPDIIKFLEDFWSKRLEGKLWVILHQGIGPIRTGSRPGEHTAESSLEHGTSHISEFGMGFVYRVAILDWFADLSSNGKSRSL